MTKNPHDMSNGLGDGTSALDSTTINSPQTMMFITSNAYSASTSNQDNAALSLSSSLAAPPPTPSTGGAVLNDQQPASSSVTLANQDTASISPAATPNTNTATSPSTQSGTPAPLLETPAGGDVTNGGFDVNIDPEGDITSSAYSIGGGGDIAGDIYVGSVGDTGNYTGFGTAQIFNDNIQPMLNGGDANVTSVNNDMNLVINQPPNSAQYWQDGIATVQSGYNVLGQAVGPGPGDAAAGFQEFAAAGGNVALDTLKAVGFAATTAAAGASCIETPNLTAGALALTSGIATISSVNDAVTILESPLSANEQAALQTVRNSVASALNLITAQANSQGLGPGTAFIIPPP